MFSIVVWFVLQYNMNREASVKERRVNGRN